MIVEASNYREIERIISEAEAVIVDFWAPWCKPCEDVEKELQFLEEGYHCEGLVIVRVNASEAGEAVLKLKVLGLPTVIAYKRGIQVYRKTGIATAEELAEKLGCKLKDKHEI